MNKKRIDENLGNAYELLRDEKFGIVEKGQILKSYRGQISSFGAAVASGSLLAAIAFFSDKGKATVNREKLIGIIMELIRKNHENVAEENLFLYVKNKTNSKTELAQVKEEILDYAISIKLAMNLFPLVDKIK